MKTNRSGIKVLQMSVAKFRAKLHEAYTKGQESAGDDQAHRQESIREICKGLKP